MRIATKLLTFGVCFGLLACSSGKAPEADKKDLGTEVGETAADTQALREASAAVNEVIRAGTDCEAARPAIAAAKQKLDDVDRALKTATGKVTLASLRKQMESVAQLCP
jgi:hypothetical protein